MSKATTMTPAQIANARNAFHYALCASTGAGLAPEHSPSSDFRVQRTRTDYIKEAWRHAKQTGFELPRPRGPVDGAPLANTIHALCARLGIDANTGAGILAAPIVEEPVYADDDEELAPEQQHRCKDRDGYCVTCFADLQV